MTKSKDDAKEPETETAGDYVVCFSSFFVIFLCDSVAMCYGLVMLELQDYFDADKASLSMVGSTLLGCAMFPGPVVSLLLEHWSLRTVLMGGTVAASTGFVIASFSKSLVVLTITYGIIAGSAVGVVYITAILMVGLRFNRHRALATGIALSGGGAGVLAMSYPFERMLAEYGWRGTILLVAGLFLNCCVFAAMIFPKQSPRKQPDISVSVEANGEVKNAHLAFPKRRDSNNLFPHSSSPLLCSSFPMLPPTLITPVDGNGEESRLETQAPMTMFNSSPNTWCSEPLLSSNSPRVQSSVRTETDEHLSSQVLPKAKMSKLHPWLRRHAFLFRNISFYMLLLVMCLYTGYSQALFYLPDLAVSRGFSRPQAALLVSMYGVTNIVGRLASGALSNHPRVDSSAVYSVGLLILAVDMALFPHCRTLPQFAVASIVFGLCCATCLSLRTIVIVDVLSRELLADAFGVVSVAQGICYMALPPLYGNLYELFSSFHAPFYLIAGMTGVAAIICGLLKPGQRWRTTCEQRTLVPGNADSILDS